MQKVTSRSKGKTKLLFTKAERGGEMRPLMKDVVGPTADRILRSRIIAEYHPEEHRVHLLEVSIVVVRLNRIIVKAQLHLSIVVQCV